PPEIEHWIQEHSPVITSTIFFRPEYGFEFLVRAVAILREKYPKMGCLVMGGGAKGEQAHEGMFLAGDLNHELCLALMARSSVFVRPALRDGDSISVREAHSMGVPVVASNVGTRPEGVMLFAPGDVEGLVDAVEQALDLPGRALSKKGPSRLEARC